MLKMGKLFYYYRTFGSLVFNKIFKEKGVRKKITFAEANSLPYNARLLEPGKYMCMG